LSIFRGLKFEPKAGIGPKGAFFKGLRIEVTDMDQNLLNIGFGNTVAAERVIAIVSPNSAPMKRLKDEAKDEKRLIETTDRCHTRPQNPIYYCNGQQPYRAFCDTGRNHIPALHNP